METSEAINELAAALAKAQSQIKPAAFNAVNPFLKNRYADLGAVIEAARAALAANGLSVAQPVSGGDGSISVTTVLMHSSGQYIAETISLNMAEERGKSLAQMAGSVITYLRRYSLASMLGIYADEDTDGHEQKPAGKAQDEKKAQVRVVEQEAAANVVQPSAPIMPYAEACAVESSTGEKYGDIPTEKLAHMANTITKSLAANGQDAEKHAEHTRKLAAIRVILAARAEQAQA